MCIRDRRWPDHLFSHKVPKSLNHLCMILHLACFVCCVQACNDDLITFVHTEFPNPWIISAWSALSLLCLLRTSVQRWPDHLCSYRVLRTLLSVVVRCPSARPELREPGSKTSCHSSHGSLCSTLRPHIVRIVWCILVFGLAESGCYFRARNWKLLCYFVTFVTIEMK